MKNDFFKLVSQIPCPLRDPENESSFAWELLWNDPLSNDMRDLDNTNNGFISNVRRGTGYFFSSKALNDFLNQNSLSYVVRAHEVQQQGFKVTRFVFIKQKMEDNVGLVTTEWTFVNCVLVKSLLWR